MKRFVICLVMIFIIGLILIYNWPKVEESKDISKEKRSVFISYIELSKYLNGKDIKEGKDSINTMLNKVEELGFNEVIIQVRSFADAIYESKIFPWSKVVSLEEGINPGYDILEEFILKAKEKDISIIAWINPYRIRTSEIISDISRENPAYKYLNTDIVYINKGIYFNPSKEETIDLIVKGVEELVNKYEVDGVLFDDYFYPNNEIDINDYEAYLINNDYITKDKYNLEVVNKMIKQVHKVCEKAGVKFGVSPDGNIENNYNKVFADVKKWCSSDEYVDFIMPQIYYGFYNETKAFKKVIDEWESIITNKDIEFRVALAFYKVGEIDKWAKSGSEEWLNNDDIIMREIMLSRNLNQYKGFALFRYDYIFDESLYTSMTIKEIENMKKVLN